MNKATSAAALGTIPDLTFRALVIVMETTSDNHQLCLGCAIHQTVRVIYAPRPVAG